MAKGIIKLLSMMIATFSAQGNTSTEHTNRIVQLKNQRQMILTNLRGPQPIKTPNQRQRRKLARQMNRY